MKSNWMIDWLLCVVVKSVGWVLRRLSPEIAVGLGMALGGLGYWLQPKRVQIGTRNLKAAFGERFTPAQIRRLLKRVFGQLGAGVVEMLRLPAVDSAYVNRYIEVVGRERFETAIASKRPVIVLEAHFGNWELSALTATLTGHPLLALAREQRNFPRLYRLLVSYRESKGCGVVHKGGATQQLLQALKRRELVGIVGDQATRKGIFVEFFGRPALCTTGPFVLAQASGALIVPVFIHRRGGPYHRVVIEPTMDVLGSAGQRREEAVRQGVEQFAGMLQRHIESDPAQWLWIHKRWKYTTQRRVLVLSDGKLGHVKQSRTVVEALKERCADAREEIVEVRYRGAWARALALVWAWLMPAGWGAMRCLLWVLEPGCARRLMSAYADVVVSCGASVAPINRLLSADLHAKSIVIMNPAPLPLRYFTLAFVPVHDGLRRRRNVVVTDGALTRISEETLRDAREQLRRHPKFRAGREALNQPTIAVLLGGETEEYVVGPAFIDDLLQQVLAVCDETHAGCLVTTSRRTSADAERAASQRLAQHPRCRLLLLASRDQLNGTLEGILGWADVVVVTGESISMMSEACASGRHVVVVPPTLRRAVGPRGTKADRYIAQLARRGQIIVRPLPEVGHAIRQVLRAPRPSPRVATYTVVRDAVARLV